MARMIRKQVYIREDQESRLKRASKELGVSESELIRSGLDKAMADAVKGREILRRGQSLMAFARSAPK